MSNSNKRGKKPAKPVSDGLDAIDKVQHDCAGVLLAIFEIGNFSDFTIICGEIQKDVHSSVLCPQLSFFRGALHGDFRYSVNLTMQYEATQRIVDLSHESEDAVGALLMLFYGTELDTGKFDPVGIAKLYQLAHQLDAVNITELIGQNLSTVLKLADETSKTILNDWIKLIEIAYIHMPEHNNVLRSVLVQGMTEWLKEYMFEPDFFGPCFEASGRFAFEVIVLLHAKKIKIW